MKGSTTQCIVYLASQDNDKVFEIKEIKPKRSLNANNYFYSLQNKLADALKTSNDELHLELLKRYSSVVLATLPSTIEPSGFFKYYEKYKEGTIKGQAVTIYKVYKPSAEMDTKEFSRLVDGIVEECQDMNISTLTPNEMMQLEGYTK